MKLRNKKTGEIVEPRKIGFEIYSFNECNYNSLEEFNEDWEDYEEPKEYWYFDSITGKTHRTEDTDCSFDDRLKEIGNYFETKEQAEKVVEKLKAWKRLKDKGFRFDSYKPYGAGITFTLGHMNEYAEDNKKDLDLLFRGEDD